MNMESSSPSGQRDAAVSVTELTQRIRDSLQRDHASVWVTGEVSDLARPQSGHCYLTLKDEHAQLRAVIWRGTAGRLRFPLEDGTEVLCHGEIDVYAPRGSYQLIVRHIEPRGEGALQLALRRLRAKLADEGLFDASHKQAIPSFPRRVGLVTSPTGAAVRDFLEVASRRWQGAEIIIFPVSVQGAAAADEIVAALQIADALRHLFDVLVVTRGGGSIEDLWTFNEERVVRAIFASRLPIVSAIGHEIDVTLADLVADLRALTPSEAAERVVPSAAAIRDRLAQNETRLHQSVLGSLTHARQTLRLLATRRVLDRPWEMLRELARRLDEIDLRAGRAASNQLGRLGELLASHAARLDSLSPLAVLGRGYSFTLHRGQILSDARVVEPGDQIRTRLAAGELTSRVEEINSVSRPGQQGENLG